MSEDNLPFASDIILYTSPSGQTRVEVWYEDETFWLTQKRMAELFGVSAPTINEHLQNVIQTGELEADSVIRKFRITAEDGKSHLTSVYHLDAIIAVGYRVNSHQATQFRIWSTGTYTRFMEKLQRIKILILDDLGISPLSQEQTEDIMEIIEARDLCASTIVTTQLPKDKIYTAFADPTLADAICDRLFRGAIDLPLKGESRRKAAPPKS